MANEGVGTSRPSCQAGHKFRRAPWCPTSGLCSLDTFPWAPQAVPALKASCHIPSSAKVPNRFLHLTLTSHHKITPVSATAGARILQHGTHSSATTISPWARAPQDNTRKTPVNSLEGGLGLRKDNSPRGLSAGPLLQGGAAGSGAPSHLSKLRDPPHRLCEREQS